MNKRNSLIANKGIFLLAFSIAACGGNDDFVSNQQNTIDGGIHTDGKPAIDGNSDNSSNAGKYPLAVGDFAHCYNAEAVGDCTIPTKSGNTIKTSTVYHLTERLKEFNVVPHSKELVLPPFNQDIDRHYSHDYLNNSFDGLTNAVNQSVYGKDGKGNESYRKFSRINGYFAGNDLMLVRNVDEWGFQTIGHLIRFNNKRQIVGDSFFTVGQPLTEISGLMDATYHGIAVGSVNGNTDTFSEVTAQLRLPEAGPYQLDLVVNNTQYTPNNLTQGFTGAYQAPNDLNFARTLLWQPRSGRFINTQAGTVTAYMYGPEGQEVGGTFAGTSTLYPHYEGAFGAKR